MTKRGSRILQGAREALAFASGKADADTFRVHVPDNVDVKKIRRKLGLSQQAFAARYGFTVGRLRDWEQGRSPIDAPSRILLLVIENEPDAIERALAAA